MKNEKMISHLQAFEFTIDFLQKIGVKYENHLFASGAIMLDIWVGDNFYVLQFEEDAIGFSDASNDDIAFDTIPDETFFDVTSYYLKLKALFKDFNESAALPVL